MAKKQKYIYLLGEGNKKYPLVKEVPGKEMIILNEQGHEERVYPQYINWTFIGFKKRKNNNEKQSVCGD